MYSPMHTRAPHSLSGGESWLLNLSQGTTGSTAPMVVSGLSKILSRTVLSPLPKEFRPQAQALDANLSTFFLSLKPAAELLSLAGSTGVDADRSDGVETLSTLAASGPQLH